MIMHNTITLDGAFSGFEFPPELMGLHYQIAGEFGESIRLVGSNTAAASIELFGGFTPETPDDFRKPNRAEGSYWVIPDSMAVLQGKLHYFRRSEYCRDAVVLVSETTPPAYLAYLKEREYAHFVAGEEKVDLEKALRQVNDKFPSETMLVDSGSGLTNAMLHQSLIDEISLLFAPRILGGKPKRLFDEVRQPIELSLKRSKDFPGGYVWLLYDVIK